MVGESAEATTTPIAPNRPALVVISPNAPPAEVPEEITQTPVNPMHLDPKFQRIEQEVEENWKNTYRKAYKPEVGASTRKIIAERLYRNRYKDEAKAYDAQQEK